MTESSDQAQVTFTSLVLSLATTAAVHFGDVGDPVTGERSRVNLEGAAQMAFKQLICADLLAPWFHTVQRADSWQGHEAGLTQAYRLLASLHNQLGITGVLPELASGFYSRPFQVIHAERFAGALVQKITDPVVLRIAGHSLIGNIDLFSDNTLLRSDVFWRPGLRRLFVDLPMTGQDSEP